MLNTPAFCATPVTCYNLSQPVTTVIYSTSTFLKALHAAWSTRRTIPLICCPGPHSNSALQPPPGPARPHQAPAEPWQPCKSPLGNIPLVDSNLRHNSHSLQAVTAVVTLRAAATPGPVRALLTHREWQPYCIVVNAPHHSLDLLPRTTLTEWANIWAATPGLIRALLTQQPCQGRLYSMPAWQSTVLSLFCHNSHILQPVAALICCTPPRPVRPCCLSSPAVKRLAQFTAYDGIMTSILSHNSRTPQHSHHLLQQ
jgi:hypothetical protein